jgi:aspartate kinase
MSGETNRLMSLGQAAGGEKPDARELDVLLASGEQVTIALLSMALAQIGIPARSFLADQITVLTDSAHGKARIEHIDTQKLARDVEQ